MFQKLKSALRSSKGVSEAASPAGGGGGGGEKEGGGGGGGGPPAPSSAPKSAPKKNLFAFGGQKAYAGKSKAVAPVQKSYDLLFKLLLIGDSGSGKSCLLLRFAVSPN